MDKRLRRRSTLSADYARQILSYDQSAGRFTWLVQKARRTPVGSVAGAVDGLGYIGIQIDGQRYQAHRLAWLYVHGRWPEGILDHVNGDRADNRIDNLREASTAENRMNSGINRNNTSGHKGVIWCPHNKKWRARISVGAKRHHLGHFTSREAAAATYEAGFQKLYPTLRRG